MIQNGTMPKTRLLVQEDLCLGPVFGKIKQGQGLEGLQAGALV